jgi:hypothetical protein
MLICAFYVVFTADPKGLLCQHYTITQTISCVQQLLQYAQTQ